MRSLIAGRGETQMPFDATPRKVNETSKGLRRMAAWHRENGYTPDERMCFVVAAIELGLAGCPEQMIFRHLGLGPRKYGELTNMLIAAGYPADPTGEKAAQLCERVAAELELA